MAVQNAIHTITLQDADGDQASLPLYVTYDDATATLASIAAYMAARCADLDAITDAQIVKQSFLLQTALPGGLKGAPVAGSDVERTGLITFNLLTPSGKAYGMDIPGFKASKFTGDAINLGDADVTTWTTNIMSLAGTMKHLNDLWSSTFTSVRKGVKSFRKLGR